MIDTHAHIYLDQFKDDLDEVIANATLSGVEQIYMPNIDKNSIDSLLATRDRYPEICKPMMGLHPCSVSDDYKKQLKIIENRLGKEDYLAVGEIGIDLYWDTTYRKEQEDALKTQVGWAKDLDLPVVLHTRDSMDLTIDLMEEFGGGQVQGVFHCFTGTVEQASRITQMGFKLGIGGVSTFKNGGMDKTLPHIDLDHIILETDSPYLAPVPHRGKRNEPSYLSLINARIAELKGISEKDVDMISTRNALKLFS